MVKICFYFQVHQPFRIKNFRVFDIGCKQDYFFDEKNKQILEKVATKCYLPMNALWLRLLEKHKELKISFSFSGVVLEQFEKWTPKVLESFQKLVATGRVEVLAETYYHSLAAIHSDKEFEEQVKLHEKQVNRLFGVQPKVFRNTELLYNNHIASIVEKMGYQAILAEGWDHVLGWKSPNFVYKPKGCKTMKLLLKNYKLSDDIAFRFSNKGWEQWPLTAEKFSNWVNAFNGSGEVINLFMDYETFGEHQWENTGIFQFMERLPRELLAHNDNSFISPSEAAKLNAVGELDVHHLLSWADMERDASAWMGNNLQNNALTELYALERVVRKTGDEELLQRWRKLQTSDHFYYMCTKYFNDGDVHRYFNPYESPYDCYIAFMNVINDLQLNLQKECLETKIPLINTQKEVEQ